MEITERKRAEEYVQNIINDAWDNIDDYISNLQKTNELDWDLLKKIIMNLLSDIDFHMNDKMFLESGE